MRLPGDSLERGPWRAALWVRLSGRRSRIDLTFHLYAGRDAVDASARVLWDERSARLDLILPVDTQQAEFEVPGGSVIRNPQGDVPGGRWVRIGDEKSSDASVGFASDSLYGFNMCPGQFHATVVRSTRYSESEELAANQQPWVPATDQGELKFRFLLAPGNGRLPSLADDLDHPPTVMLVPSSNGKLPAIGSLLSLEPQNLRLLAFKRSEDDKDWVLRIAEMTGQTTQPRLTFLQHNVVLKEVPARQIATYRIEQTPEGFMARVVDASEVPAPEGP